MEFNRFIQRLKHRLILLSLIVTTTACTNSLVVHGDFPKPLSPSLPINMGLHLDETIVTAEYTEASEERSKWVIQHGNAQEKFFNTITPALFANVIKVDTIPTAETPRGDVDLVLSPAIMEFQYSVPRETKVNVFETWLKYNLKVYDQQGGLIADWILTAYGKTPTAFMRSKEEAMNEAVIVALRDLGARLTLNFQRVPEIKQWLAQHGKLAEVTPPAQQK